MERSASQYAERDGRATGNGNQRQTMPHSAKSDRRMTPFYSFALNEILKTKK